MCIFKLLIFQLLRLSL